MKKLLICILLMGLSTYAQDKDNYFSASIGMDAKNTTSNLTYDLHAVAENFDFNIGLETFNKIEYNRKYVALGYHIPIGYIVGTDVRFSIQPSLAFSNITRGRLESDQDPKRSYSTPSANINLNWDLNDYFAVQIATTFVPRTDLKIIYHKESSKIETSGVVKLVFKIPNN